MPKTPRTEGLHSDIADDVIAEALRSVEKYKQKKAREAGEGPVDLEETIESIVVPEELVGDPNAEMPFEVPIEEIARTLDTPEPPPPRRPERAMSDAAQQLLERLKARTVELTREVQTLEAALADKTAEAQKNHDRMVWLTAELENTKKRQAREKAELEKYGAEKLLREFLPVMDNLERALHHARENADHQVLSEGVQLTLTQFANAFKRQGVTRIELSPGAPFDPALHEAMMHEESDLAPNSVVREMLSGYLLQDRLLRASLVTVARPVTSRPTPAAPEEPREASAASPTPEPEASAAPAPEENAPPPELEPRVDQT